MPSQSGVSQFSVGSNDHYCEISNGQMACRGFPPEDHGEFDVPKLNGAYLTAANGSTSGSVDITGAHSWGGINANVANGAPQSDLIRAFDFRNTSLACILDESGVFCWSGLSSAGFPNTPTLPRASLLATGSNHACAVEDRKLYCWGPEKTELASVPPFLENEEIVAIAADSSVNCVITRKGQVRCWGGSVADVSVPELQYPIAISASSNHVCAIDVRGNSGAEELWSICWGAGETDADAYPNWGQSVDQYLGPLMGSGIEALPVYQ